MITGRMITGRQARISVSQLDKLGSYFKKVKLSSDGRMAGQTDGRII